MDISLEGMWKVRLSDGTEGEMRLPGTLDENGLGPKDEGKNQWHPDVISDKDDGLFRKNAPIATRFTRKHSYEGEARLRKRFDLKLPEKKRVFLEAERARVLKLFVDGRQVPPCRPASISSPWRFEVTGLLDGEHEIELISDNSYPGLPRDAIVYSSAATDETQTNWNGILGRLRLEMKEPVFLQGICVYPAKESLSVRVEINGDRRFRGSLRLKSDAFAEDVELEVEGEAGVSRTELADLPLAGDVKLWDEEEGNLYELQAELEVYEVLETGETSGGRISSSERTTFGIRTFGDNGEGRLALNGRTVFLRSEANCAEFPETGHPPMKVEEWEDILGRYRAYGVNCMRFHSHCPPEAAFTAADRMGMLMQPELSHWNPRDAFESEESFAYYREELEGILRMLANHPSFVMLTFGNELHAGEKGHERMTQLLRFAKSIDPTRLYANASNAHYGSLGCDPESDFYTSQNWHDLELRGTFAGMKGYMNHEYPGARHNFDREMKKLREEYEKPVFSFEVGQYEVLPDFRELEDFRGVSLPINYELIRDRVRERGLEDIWEQYVEATGELSRIGYREEVEAALRTGQLSGISLLGLQDFPGQGTALVGMLNSHLEQKPYDFARPERFRSFFRESLPLVLLEKYTYVRGETLQADILMANYGKEAVSGPVRYRLYRSGGADAADQNFAPGIEAQMNRTLGQAYCPPGENTVVGRLEVPLNFGEKAVRLDLTVSVGGIENTYPLWVYPQVRPECPAAVYETRFFDDAAKKVLADGGIVYLSPDSDREHLPRSIQAQFTTDFWSVGTFADQEGGMGQLIDADHPIFRNFPTEFHTNWQWWVMAGQRAAILPGPMKCIITEMDSYAFLRPMTQLAEFRCGGGKVLFSTLGLQNLKQYPEAAALLAAVYEYLGSESFDPVQELEPDELAKMVSIQPCLQEPFVSDGVTCCNAELPAKMAAEA